jgi:hypothetical protein
MGPGKEEAADQYGVVNTEVCVYFMRVHESVFCWTTAYGMVGIDHNQLVDVGQHNLSTWVHGIEHRFCS